MAKAKPTIKHVIIYVASFIAILYLFYALPSGAMESATAQASTLVLRLLGYSARWEQIDGQTMLTLIGQRTVIVTIIRECTALNVLGVMTGLILPLEARWAKSLAQPMGRGVEIAVAFAWRKLSPQRLDVVKEAIIGETLEGIHKGWKDSQEKNVPVIGEEEIFSFLSDDGREFLIYFLEGTSSIMPSIDRRNRAEVAAIWATTCCLNRFENRAVAFSQKLPPRKGRSF
jgi:hypothetical protein